MKADIAKSRVKNIIHACFYLEKEDLMKKKNLLKVFERD